MAMNRMTDTDPTPWWQWLDDDHHDNDVVKTMMTMHINVMMPQRRQPNLWPRGSLPRPHVSKT